MHPEELLRLNVAEGLGVGDAGVVDEDERAAPAEELAAKASVDASSPKSATR